MKWPRATILQSCKVNYKKLQVAELSSYFCYWSLHANMFKLKCNLPRKLVCTQIQDYNYSYRMLLTGELSLDGKASPFLCPFYLERKETMQAANILMSASFVFSGYLRPLWSSCCQKCLLWLCSFFLADQLFCYRLWEWRLLIWWTSECVSQTPVSVQNTLCF